jgi:hypothetical protein
MMEYSPARYNLSAAVCFTAAADAYSFHAPSLPLIIPKYTPSTPLLAQRQHLLNAQRSMLNGEISKTEEFLHKFFDSNGKHPLHNLSPAAGGGSGNEISVKKALMSLVHLDTTKLTQSLHQDAMISLATMWTLAGNHSMALSAVEEAMKTAHQRGDHASVTKALLLIFQIFQNSQERELMVSSEDILLRCIERCASLSLKKELCEAAILLVRLRSRAPLR